MGSPSEKLADRVVSEARKKVGGPAVVGGKDKGGIDCFALIDSVLKSLDAKSASDFGEVKGDSDYVWGEEVQLSDIQPGDILQFRHHEVTTTTLTLGRTKWETTLVEGPARRPHHSAIVVEARTDGSVLVVEQNVKPNAHKVTLNIIKRLDTGTESRMITNTQKVSIMVTGAVRAYRPASRH